MTDAHAARARHAEDNARARVMQFVERLGLDEESMDLLLAMLLESYHAGVGDGLETAREINREVAAGVRTR